jgi:YbgC/YbaW family acyl-CoA thioester hydrolase
MITFEYSLTIKEHHLDTFGHVNNGKYLEIFEEARWDLLRLKGFSLEEVLKNKVGPIILGINMQFKKELRNQDKIVITTQCTTYEKKIGELVQVMKKENGEEACVAKFTFGLFDLKARKLMDPTPQWLEAIGVLSD